MKMIGICPTLARPDMATRLMRSAENNTEPLDIRFSKEERPRALTTCINDLLAAVRNDKPDVVFLLGDHVELDRDCVAEVRRIFETHHPSTMAAVGMNIINLKPGGWSPYAFMAVGAALLDTFPDWAAFCPDYYHFFGDTELGEYAKWMDVFTLAEHAQIITHSPSAGNAKHDDTYRAGRQHKQQDLHIRAARQKRGLLWGRDFERINPGGWP